MGLLHALSLSPPSVGNADLGQSLYLAYKSILAILTLWHLNHFFSRGGKIAEVGEGLGGEKKPLYNSKTLSIDYNNLEKIL